ncbi:MAG: tryptophan 2,3-dioxygenase [Acidobacteria bacterium]|nr:tryptophan 2,3-dioxygenase [Acidobacteriota bacterium]
MSQDPIYYSDYLQLGKLLDSQHLESTKAGETVHDEMLFIIVHQAYELWFKQILWELDDVLGIFSQNPVPERFMGRVVARLRRIVEIQDILIKQVAVLETMTPIDFLDFRDYLFPASGFQSAQFRLVENRLGMRPEDRLLLEGAPYTERFDTDDKAAVVASESDPSLFDLIEQWLERTPFLESGEYRFWEEFESAVRSRLERDRIVVAENPNLTTAERKAQLGEFKTTMRQYEAIFDADKHAAMTRRGERRFSYGAFQSALFITLYQDLPALQEPNRVIELLMDIDEGFTAWRHRHAQMAQRMIGRRIGTGGSAGAKYLEKSAERSRVFADLFNLATFLVPNAERPELPEAVAETMRFRYQV